MKTALKIIALVMMTGIAVVVAWNVRDGSVNDPASSAESVAPVVGLAALKAKAETGDAEAACQLAKSLVKGEHGLPNYAEAAKLFQLAVDKGHVEAMVGLAELYTLGQGVTNNPAEGVRLYVAAAQQGNIKAIYSLAGLYEEGRGVKKDQTAAAKWHQMAAERGAALAQFNLGQRYELGMGVKPDLIEALKWLRLAEKNGIKDASEMIGRLQPKMSRDQIAEATRRANSFSLVTAAPLQSDLLSP